MSPIGSSIKIERTKKAVNTILFTKKATNSWTKNKMLP